MSERHLLTLSCGHRVSTVAAPTGPEYICGCCDRPGPRAIVSDVVEADAMGRLRGPA